LMLAYRNFGSLSYYGVDVAFDFFASDALSIFGNVSWVSDDFFDNTELDEVNPDLSLALNATTLKGRLGVKYRAPSGLSVNASVRYTDGFPIRSGPYSGDLPSYTLVDLGFGFDLSSTVPGLSVDLGLNNALDNGHREFVGAPQLGRMAIARLTYSI
jgi:outer membrane receptor for ferrienterochelin and colicins